MRAIAGLLVACLTGAAAADAPELRLSQFGVERWDRQDGLAGNWVRDIVQTPDGFLWIATSGGLSRFDGRTFHNFTAANTPAFDTNPVASLALGAEGRVWIGLERGGVRVMHSGRVERDPRLDTIPSIAVVTNLLEDSTGALWIGTARGLWRAGYDDVARQVAVDMIRTAEVMEIVSPNGTDVWVRTRDRGLLRFVDGEAKMLSDAPACRGYGLAFDSKDTAFTSCDDGVWRRDDVSGNWLRISSASSVGPLIVDHLDDVWFCSRSVLERWSDGRTESLPIEESTVDWRVRGYLEDRDGNLWIGTFSGGLTRLQRGAARAFGTREGLPVELSTAILARPDGDVWIAGFEQGLALWRPSSGIVRRWTVSDGLPAPTVWALAADPRDPSGVWAGTDEGLSWFDVDSARAHTANNPTWNGSARLIYVDPAPGAPLWVSGLSGIYEVSKDGVTIHDATNGLELDRALLFHRDHTGRLLAGGNDGLFALDGARWTRVTADGPPLRALTAIAEEDDGTIWLASLESGIVRLGQDGATHYGADRGLPFSHIHAVALDNSGGLWASDNDGILRLRLDDHARWRRGEIDAIPFEILSRRDGLRDVECNGWGRPSVTIAPGGTLAFPTMTGATLVDPSRMPDVSITPDEIYVEGAWTGSRQLPVDREIQLTETERSLLIRFSAIELLRPETVAFRYRLDGFDDTWISAGRVAEASWAHVAPGTFRFRLQARTPGGEWVESARSLVVSVTPGLWERTSTRVAIVVAIALLTILLFHWRMRLASRFAEAIASERSFLRNVIDVSPNPIFVRRSDGTYSLANRSAAAIYGLKPGDLEGKAPTDLGRDIPGMETIDELDAAVIESASERLVAEQEVVDHEGRRRWFRVVKRPGFEGDEVTEVLGSAVDVTDFKLAEQSLQASREEARRLAGELMRAQEQERKRLGRELHDDVTQRLAGLAMLAMGLARKVPDTAGGDLRRTLEEVAAELEALVNDLQALARDLHSEALERLGLDDALRAECSTFSRRTGLDVRFDASGGFADVAPQIRIALYRITQEALRNCLTHAEARTISVTLTRGDGAIRLEVRDDGIGFEPSAATDRPGLGLASMKERARLLGGEITIESAPGEGTRIVVTVPEAV